MQAVILAAGEGTRMRPLTYKVPKPMLPVNGKPIVAYTIEALPAEVDEVIFVVGYLGNQVREYFGDEYSGKKIVYVEQKEFLGTGDAVALCEDKIKDRFLVLYGDDIFSPEDIKRAMVEERCLFAKAVMAAEKRNYGVFEVDKEGHLISIVETELEAGETGLVFTGLALLDKNLFKYKPVSIKNGKEFGLPQTVVELTKDYPVKILTTEVWLPIGYPEDLPKAEDFMKKIGIIK